jgi:hypothetical protein
MVPMSPPKIQKTVSFKVGGNDGTAPESPLPAKSAVKLREAVWLRDKAKVFAQGTVVSGIGDDGKLGVEMLEGGSVVRVHKVSRASQNQMWMGAPRSHTHRTC